MPRLIYHASWLNVEGKRQRRQPLRIVKSALRENAARGVPHARGHGAKSNMEADAAGGSRGSVEDTVGLGFPQAAKA